MADCEETRVRPGGCKSGGMMSHKRALLLLRESGARMTAQRKAVLDILEGNRSHPTVEAITEAVRQRLGYVSPATIYNTLESLCRLGLVRRVQGLEEKAHFDPDTSIHEHAICRECRAVFDVQDIEVNIPDFTPEEIVVRGICRACESRIQNRDIREDKEDEV